MVELESLRSHTFKVEVPKFPILVEPADRETQTRRITGLREGELHGGEEIIHYQADSPE